MSIFILSFNKLRNGGEQGIRTYATISLDRLMPTYTSAWKNEHGIRRYKQA